VKLRAAFDNKNGALFPNQFVNARLLVDTLTGVTLIPSGAVQHNGDAAFVYVIDPAANVAHMRQVRTAVSNGGVIAVSGINPGEQVATSSFDKLQDKVKVAISKPASASRPAEGHTP
jgi:multidrug efflux system membrane fusion protein